MKAYLLDVNVLLSLAWPTQIHHEITTTWFRRTGQADFRTCPFTEAAFVRISSNRRVIKSAVAPIEAAELLGGITSLPGHGFWAADLPLGRVMKNGLLLRGHRQIMGAYLIALAAEHGGIVATLDRGAAALAPDPSLVELVQG